MRVCYPYVWICGEIIDEVSDEFVRVKWDDGSVTTTPRYFLKKEEDISQTHKLQVGKEFDEKDNT